MSAARTALACALLGGCGLAQAELGVNLYVASYHFERDTARKLGIDNEFNPGLGLRWRRVPGERLEIFADAGFYRDSARRIARLFGGGALWRVSESARLGGALVLLKSETYNRGDAFLAPAPLAAYELGGATLNVVYFPKVGDINAINQLGFWLTVWLR